MHPAIFLERMLFMTKEIRTPKGKLYGTLDVHAYTITTIDGKNIRQTPLPKEGCTLRYKAGNSLPEVIMIPSQDSMLSLITQ